MERLQAAKMDRPDLKHKWCGPTVICSLTGKKYSEVIAAFREIIPGVATDDGVRGTTTWQMEKVLEKFGWKLIRRDYFARTELPPSKYGVADQYGRYRFYDSSSRPTLANYAAKNRAKFQRHAMLVEVTGHWTSLFGRRGMDNHTPNYAPVPLRSLNFRRARVISTWSVVKMDEAYIPTVVLPAPPKPPKSPFKRKPKVYAAAVGAVANRKANEIASKIDYSDIVAKLDKAIKDAST